MMSQNLGVSSSTQTDASPPCVCGRSATNPDFNVSRSTKENGSPRKRITSEDIKSQLRLVEEQLEALQVRCSRSSVGRSAKPSTRSVQNSKHKLKKPSNRAVTKAKRILLARDSRVKKANTISKPSTSKSAARSVDGAPSKHKVQKRKRTVLSSSSESDTPPPITSLPYKKIPNGCYQCLVKDCPVKPMTLRNFRRHMGVHEHGRQKPKSSNVRVILCPAEGCGKKFWDKVRFDRHYPKHTGELLVTCRQTGCGLQFPTKISRHIHERTHANLKTIICETCGMGFRTPSKHRMHQRIHTGEKPYQCESCGQQFARSEYLLKHKRTVHDNQNSLGRPERPPYKRRSTNTQTRMSAAAMELEAQNASIYLQSESVQQLLHFSQQPGTSGDHHAQQHVYHPIGFDHLLYLH